jgi:hypothetical protein
MKKPMSRPFSGDEVTQQINHIHIFNPNLMITEINEIDINILDKIHWDDKENPAHEVDNNESEHGVNIPDEITKFLYLIDKIMFISIS